MTLICGWIYAFSLIFLDTWVTIMTVQTVLHSTNCSIDTVPLWSRSKCFCLSAELLSTEGLRFLHIPTCHKKNDDP